MRLSLLVPTHDSAATIERTLQSAFAQTHRPLEILVYDESSRDETRAIVARVLARAPAGVEVDFQTAEVNSGPVRAWRVPLHRSTGDWCCFLWADDVLEPDFSTAMMAAAGRAEAAGRKLVFASALVERDGAVEAKYSQDQGVVDAITFSFGIFLRRYSVNQVDGVYESAAARRIFDRHIDIPNEYGFDYARQPYGNDVGFLSELAAAGPGVELVGERLVRLVLSSTSMTRAALRARLWQFRWQYTFNILRVWTEWQERNVAGGHRLVAMARRRLELCALMMRRRRPTPRRLAASVLALRDYWLWDYERRPLSLSEYRRRVERLRRT